ncbi:MAG: SpoIIE family protein phosphatase [Desulfobacca sp.]|nr:SpoIIE family protein phosphatase [Desulfobacca sp.]
MPDKILIIDDSVENRVLLLRTLGKAGYEITEAGDGQEGLTRAREFLPDLILLDIVMPELDGYQVCEALKRDLHTADIPVIFLSAKTESKDKIKGLEIGGVDYITKPFDRGEVLARVQTQLKIRHLMQELLEKQKRLEEDLKAAACIQETLLPTELSVWPELDIAWKFLPCDLIGGDIFNVVRLDETHLGFYMVDVSGHGVPSAMVTVSVSQLMSPERGYLKKKAPSPPYYEIVSPQEVLRALDEEYPFERFQKFFTIVYLVLDLALSKMVYSSAAHPPPLLLHADGGLELLDKGGTIIGLNGVVPFEQEEKRLQPGDKVILYTDGVVEYCNREGEPFGVERLYHITRSWHQRPISEILDGIHQTLTDFGHQAKIEDDISLLGFEFKG